MGSKLSPYLANIFMSELEETLKKNKLFPRIWYRYVDDVFAVVKGRMLSKILELINNQFETISFTVEEENEDILPFLDVAIHRTEEGKLDFSIYRKPTHTDRYITSDSHHNGSHKQAAFHSMVHRMYNIPMSNENVEKEKNYIFDVAEKNGYGRKFVEKIMRKHELGLVRQNSTTLQPIKEAPDRRICVPYFPAFTNKLKSVLGKHNIELVTSSSTLKSYICKYKDSTPLLQKSGIYCIECAECDLSYIGQTKRPITTRIQDHVRHTEKEETYYSSVAEHMVECGHSFDTDRVKVLCVVQKAQHLDAYESLYIANHEGDLMNKEDAPISSSLFQFANLG